MAKLAPVSESSTRALFLHATGFCDSGAFKTLLRLYCVAGFMQGVFIVKLKDDEIIDAMVSRTAEFLLC